MANIDKNSDAYLHGMGDAKNNQETKESFSNPYTESGSDEDYSDYADGYRSSSGGSRRRKRFLGIF